MNRQIKKCLLFLCLITFLYAVALTFCAAVCKAAWVTVDIGNGIYVQREVSDEWVQQQYIRNVARAISHEHYREQYYRNYYRPQYYRPFCRDYNYRGQHSALGHSYSNPYVQGN